MRPPKEDRINKWIMLRLFHVSREADVIGRNTHSLNILLTCWVNNALVDSDPSPVILNVPYQGCIGLPDMFNVLYRSKG